MSMNQETRLSQRETDSILERHETGVLSLAKDDEPYAIPISYGYDANQRSFYIRLVSTQGSEKVSFLGSTPKARFIVYEENDPVYRSVVTVGTLKEVSREELTVEDVEQYGKAKRPLFEIWGESRRELDIQLYELSPEEISGRRMEIDRRENSS